MLKNLNWTKQNLRGMKIMVKFAKNTDSDPDSLDEYSTDHTHKYDCSEHFRVPY